jgi:hypothetical protein
MSVCIIKRESRSDKHDSRKRIVRKIFDFPISLHVSVHRFVQVILSIHGSNHEAIAPVYAQIVD